MSIENAGKPMRSGPRLDRGALENLNMSSNLTAVNDVAGN